MASNREAGIFWNASSDGAKMVIADDPAERNLLKKAEFSIALASTENRPSCALKQSFNPLNVEGSESGSTNRNDDFWNIAVQNGIGVQDTGDEVDHTVGGFLVFTNDGQTVDSQHLGQKY